MYKLIKIDEHFSDEQWQELFAVRQSQQPMIVFNLKSWQSLKEVILGYYKDEEKYICYVVVNSEGKCIGNFSCYEDENETENIGRVLRPKVNLLPEWQTDEIIGLFLGKLVETYDNSLKIRFIDYNGLNDKWLVKWGGIFKIHVESHKLKYSDIDKDKLVKWADSGKSNNPEFRLRFCETKDLNDDEMIEYLSLHNTGLDNSLGSDSKASEVFEKYDFHYQIPLKLIESDINANEETGKHICQMVLLYDSAGRMAAFTQVGLDFKIPKEFINRKPVTDDLYKGMTYARPEYRGRGLGKWLNSELYLKLLENYSFEEIETEMIPCNSYIQNINRDFGYRKQENSYNKEYVFELSELQKLLQH